MRVVQLIDTLNTGGAERLAVSYANLLAKDTKGSYLCTTRGEGLLKATLNDKVGYLFLNRKYIIDFRAIAKFLSFIKKNKITVVHAHATSFFFATVIKCCYPKLKIIWHDHYGKSESLANRPVLFIKYCSLLFNQIIVVNQKLLDWASSKTWCENIRYLPNIVTLDNCSPSTMLKGNSGKRILCLANLRPQKDHLNLFSAMLLVNKMYPDWTLHCVGLDFKDDYSREIKQYVSANNLEEVIYFYDSRPDIKNIIKQSDIGVLSSKSEGLPITLLEYGFLGLPVIATHVGNCELVITSDKMGQLIPSNNSKALSKALMYYIAHETIRRASGLYLKKHIQSQFTSDTIKGELLKIYKKIS